MYGGGGGDLGGGSSWKAPDEPQLIVGKHDDGSHKGKGGHSQSGAGKQVYRIGKTKITLDGKDGKTLDDIIEELVATSGSERNWKGMFIATLVILAVFGLIVISVIVLTPPEENVISGDKISFGDFLAGNLTGKKFNATWISDSELVFLDSSSSVILLDVSSMSRQILVPNSTYLKLRVTSFGVSPDKKFVYLAHHYYKNFRYSSWAQYTIYEVKTGNTVEVNDVPADSQSSKKQQQQQQTSSADPSDAADAKAVQPYLELFTWTRTGNAYAFVYHNNIYFKPAVHASSDTVIPISSDGVKYVVFNGVPDWLYEEEILASNSALWFSPNNQQLAYIHFNDSSVHEVRMPYYEYSANAPYVRYGQVRYPKAGTANPVVELRVVDMSSPGDEETFVLRPPPIIAKTEHYIVAVTWIDSNLLSVIWMNRAQNLSIVAHCEQNQAKRSWECQEVYRETVVRGWVNLYDVPLYHPDGKEEFLVLAPISNGKKGYYRHVLKVNFSKTSKLEMPLTHGAYEVKKVHGWDESRVYIYFTASPEGQPSQRHLYRVVSSEVSEGTQTPECVSCSLVNSSNRTESEISLLLRKHVVKRGGRRKEKPLPTVLTPHGCMHNDAYFSKGLKYFVLDCNGPDIPRVLLYNTANATESMPTPLLELEDNNHLRVRVLNISMPNVRTFRVPLSSGYKANVKMYLPEEITVKTFASYPFIVNVYAGPGSQITKTDWKHNWASYLASNRGWIVAQIDGRGSGGDGDRRRYEVFERLGTVEVADQIEVAKYLADNLPIIDPRRIAIWGWSYGGYAAMRALSDERQDIFQCAIAVAPVTNWRFYDSVYSERYMGQPGLNGNFQGYESSDLLSRAHLFHPTQKTMRKLYLIHGTRDDNVHIQHSMLMAKALVEKGVNFQQQVYPDATHSFTSVSTHFYLSMENFLDKCFSAFDRDDGVDDIVVDI